MGLGCMSIRFQHAEARIEEFENMPCEQFIGVGRSVSDGLSIFFICVSGKMYKFFIDENVIFLEGAKQDVDEDLSENEVYIDLMSHFGVDKPQKLKSFEMHDGELIIDFINVGIKLFNKNDITFLEKYES